MCQLINLVRNFDWTVGADAEDFTLPTCSSILGLNELPSCHSDGHLPVHRVGADQRGRQTI